MEQQLSYFAGRDGFIWWIGVVEDRGDPAALGRVRVRVFGYHTEDKTKLPKQTTDLDKVFKRVFKITNKQIPELKQKRQIK